MLNFIKTIFILSLLIFTLDICRYFFYPDIDFVKYNNPSSTAFIEFRKSEWIEKNIKQDVQQKWVNFYDISPNIIDAVLIGEDDKFWKHDGFDIDGMEQALERSVEKGKIAGGSTISQQVAKNLYLSPTKNPARKVKEAILTWRIEKRLSKERILEIYLNIAEWGDGIFGIEAASEHYYHKSAAKLTRNEAAHLAAVLPNPIRFDPKGDQEYVKVRSKTILKVLMKRKTRHV